MKTLIALALSLTLCSCGARVVTHSNQLLSDWEKQNPTMELKTSKIINDGVEVRVYKNYGFWSMKFASQKKGIEITSKNGVIVSVVMQ